MNIARLRYRLSDEFLAVISGAGYIFVCRVFGAVVAFFTQMLLARWMGAEELGRYVLAYSWLMMLAVIPVSGQIGAAMRFIGQGIADGNPGYARGFIRYATTFVLIGSVSMALVGGVVFITMHESDRSTQLLYLAAMLAVPAMAKIKLDSGMANAFSLFSLSFLPNSVIRPVLYLGALLVAWMLIGSMDAEIAMWIHFVALVVVAVPLSVYFHRSTRGRVEGTQPVYETSVWNRTSASLILLSLFTNYLPDIMVITSGFFVPSAELGIFNAALRLAILTKFGLFAVDAFVAPAITAHQRKNEREDLIRVMRHSTRLRLLAALIPLVIFALAGKFILGLFGEEFRDGYTILLILSASYLVVGAVGPAGRLLSVSGFHIQALKASQLALILWIVIAPLMLWQFGAIGGAVAGLITLAMWSFALWSYVRRYFSINTLSLLIN